MPANPADDGLLRELVAERFRPTGRRIPPPTRTDTPEVIERRRQILVRHPADEPRDNVIQLRRRAA